MLGSPTVDATDLEIGDDFRIWSGHRQTLISGWGRLRIGDRCFVNVGTVLLCVEEIVVGDDVAFANEVYVMDSNSHGVEGRAHVQAPVRIGDGTWLGARAMVLPGVTIGGACWWRPAPSSRATCPTTCSWPATRHAWSAR